MPDDVVTKAIAANAGNLGRIVVNTGGNMNYATPDDAEIVATANTGTLEIKYTDRFDNYGYYFGGTGT